jgi:uncharacterized membrane protein
MAALRLSSLEARTGFNLGSIISKSISYSFFFIVKRRDDIPNVQIFVRAILSGFSFILLTKSLIRGVIVSVTPRHIREGKDAEYQR